MHNKGGDWGLRLPVRGFLAVIIEKNVAVVWVFLRFHQVNLQMTYKLSPIPAKGHSRLQVEDMLSDANNAAEPFYENLKAKMFPTCWQVSVQEK